MAFEFGKKTGAQFLHWLREEGFQENTIKIFEGMKPNGLANLTVPILGFRQSSGWRRISAVDQL